MNVHAALALPTLLLLAHAADWPQYNGPRHDRRSAEALALPAWPADGPAAVWRADTPGGFSSFTTDGERVYTLVTRDGREACLALDRDTGAERWSRPLDVAEYDGGGDRGTETNSGGDGPRSTPSVAGGRVHVLDANLGLHAFDAESGEPLWHRDLVKEHDGRQIRWQNAASPLVEDGRVFLAGGGAGQSLLAFDAADGSVLWKAGDETMTHATPVMATLHGVRQVIFLVQSGLVAVVPETGIELWRTPFDYRVSTAASPVVYEDLVYVSAGYGTGSGLYRVSRDGEEFSAENVWRKRNKLMNHWSTPVCKDGFLYGMFSFKEYGDGPLECVELATGEKRWSVAGFGPGNCILVGGTLVALSDAGEVVLVDPSPEAYRELARADVLGGKCWSSPTFSDGQLFVRSTTEGKRLDLGAAAD